MNKCLLGYVIVEKYKIEWINAISYKYSTRFDNEK